MTDTTDMRTTTLLIGDTTSVGGLGGLDGGGIATITGLIDPTSDQEAATKKYVDDEIISAFASFTSVAMFESTQSAQGPTILDTPVNVEFGAIDTGNAYFHLTKADVGDTEASVITVQQDGFYEIAMDMQACRAADTGWSQLMFQLFIDGTAEPGNFVSFSLDNDEEVYSANFPRLFGVFSATTELTLQIARHSIDGNNDGGLCENLVNSNIATWLDIPSARVEMFIIG